MILSISQVFPPAKGALYLKPIYVFAFKNAERSITPEETNSKPPEDNMAVTGVQVAVEGELTPS